MGSPVVTKLAERHNKTFQNAAVEGQSRRGRRYFGTFSYARTMHDEKKTLASKCGNCSCDIIKAVMCNSVTPVGGICQSPDL